MAGVIVRRLQAVVRKPVALFGAPQPAVVYFFDFFAWDRMTVLSWQHLSSYQLWTSIIAAEFGVEIVSPLNHESNFRCLLSCATPRKIMGQRHGARASRGARSACGPAPPPHQEWRQCAPIAACHSSADQGCQLISLPPLSTRILSVTWPDLSMRKVSHLT
jgi:hypothetical protein